MKEAWLHQKAGEKPSFSLHIKTEITAPGREVAFSWKANDGELKSQLSCKNAAVGTVTTGWLKWLQSKWQKHWEVHLHVCKHSISLLTVNKDSRLSTINMISLISICLYHCLDCVLNSAIKSCLQCFGKQMHMLQKYTVSSLQKYHR